MLALPIIGWFVMAVWTTLALGLAFLYLYRHYGRTVRQLLTRLLNKPQEDGDDSYDRRPQAEYLVYSHYLTKYASIAYHWVSQTFHIYVRHPSDSSNHKCNEASSKGFIQTRHFPVHMRTIVSKLWRRVNH
jgi:hypothetical protein